MKKLATLALAIAMLVSLASVASAMTFTIGVSCTSTTSYTNAPGTEAKSKSGTNGRIYVQSHDNVDTDEYTNHFRGQEVNGSTRTTRGSKWVTQYSEIPIQNANIKAPKVYSVSARGNTNYSNYDGVSSITLSGYFLSNK